jgi:ACS family tartrate transporter-like MFS transporter
MARDETSRTVRHGLSRLRALAHPRVGLLILVYFTIAMGTNGFGFYAPAILKREFPVWEADQIGYLFAIPNTVAAIGMMLAGRHSDRSGERRWHLAVAAVLAATGWVLSATLRSPWFLVLSLTIAQVGMMSMMGPFWSLATSFLSGTAAAGGIALINTIANIGGALSPPLIGILAKSTGSFAPGQLMLALTLLFGGSVALVIRHDPRAERVETSDTDVAAPVRA